MVRFNHDFSSRFRILKGGKVSLVVSALLGSAIIASAAPTGGVVTSGNATISQSGTTTNINQSSNKASINWQDFSIKSNETVNFNQPNVNSITLNRVVGNEKSVIDGALNANGQVWILNSNGVLFSKDAKINTAGILATTAQLSDADFQAGNYNFKNATGNSVVNLGTIEVSEGGYVVLASNEVRNAGTIKAVKGKVHLTGASEYTVNLNGNSIVNLVVTKGVLDAMVENSGTIIANGGEIYLTTNAVNELLKGVVNNSGILEANSIDDLTGKVEVYAHGGTANVSGTIEAVGGFVETSGENLGVADGTVIKAKTWLLDPTNITIASDGAGAVNGTDAELTISANTIQTALTSADVSLQADNDININEALSLTSNKKLTLEAGNNININETISTNNISAELDMQASNDINFNAGVTVTQGMFNATANNDINIDGQFSVSDSLNFMAGNNLNLKKSLTTNNTGYVYLSAKKDLTVDDIITLNNSSEVYLESKNTIINDIITVGDSAKLNLSYGWIGTGWNAAAYGHDGKITFGMNEAKTDFVGKIDLSELSTIKINTVTQTIIRTKEQLQAMGNLENLSGKYVLANDIDLNNVTWTPIGSKHNDTEFYSFDFKGSFNGLGHTISNLTLSEDFTQSDYDIRSAAGLFGNVAGGANIASVRLNNASITNTSTEDNGSYWAAPTAALVGEARAEYDTENDEFMAAPMIHNNIVTESDIQSTGKGGNVAAIVGRADGATISGNAVTSTTVSSANAYNVGGIVGEIYRRDEFQSTITDSYVADSTIKAAYGAVGGIAGYTEGVIIDNATVKNSSIYTTGIIQGSYGAGGIVGDAEAYDGDDYVYSEIKNSSVENSTIAAMQDVGGLVGYMDNGTRITNSFYDLINTKIGDKTGDNIGDNIAGVITYGGIDNAEYASWLSGNKAALSASSLLGAADSNGYYSIDNVADFRKMLALAYDPANKFKLTDYITLDEGLYLPVLRGELNGNSKVVMGLNVSQSYNSYIGLIGRIEGGTVKNLMLVSPTLNGYSYVGGIAGNATQNYEGTKSPSISDVAVDGFTYSYTKEFNVASQHIDTSVYNIGAIAGNFENGTLSNVHASSEYADSSITINLTANHDGFDDVDVEYIGGLLGSMYNSTLDTASSSVAINVNVEAKAHTNFQANGANTVGAYNIGGLIGEGENNALIKDVSANGAMSIKSTYEKTVADDLEGGAQIGSIGGLFGYMGDSYIKSATATNAMTLENNHEMNSIGGVAGYISSSFFDTATTSGNIAITLDEGASYLGSIGGAIGVSYDSILKDIDSTRNIITTDSVSDAANNIGGLVGNASETNIINSNYVGTIDVNSLENVSNVGGLVGNNYGSTSDREYAEFRKTIAADAQNKQAQEAALLTEYNQRADVIALIALGYELNNDSYDDGVDGYRVTFSIQAPDSTEWGVITDSTASVNIKAQHAQNVGGLVGNMDTEDGGQIINGSVTALNGTSKVEGDSNVGGLVGKNYNGNITNSDVAINVEAKSTSSANVGGLVGYNEGGSRGVEKTVDIQDSYSLENDLKFATQEEAEEALATKRTEFTEAILAANLGYEVDYDDLYVTQFGNDVNYYVYGRLNLVKEQPIGTISNSSATGSVTSAGDYAGGLVGNAAYQTTITDSYATGAVTNTKMYTGGLVGSAEENVIIKNSHATGAVSGTVYVGGLVGAASDSMIDTSYSTGIVNGTDIVGGLVGMAVGTEIIDSYHTTGKVTGAESTEGMIGGLIGQAEESSISGSYATSEVVGEAVVGGLVGISMGSTIENSYATGKVTASGLEVDEEIFAGAGGLVGGAMYGMIKNSYATGEVDADGIYAGGLIGYGIGIGAESDFGVYQSYATGQVTGTSQVGGLIGMSMSNKIEESYSTGKATGITGVGGFIGQDGGSEIQNVYSSGEVVASGDNVGSLMGQADGTTLTNSYSSGKITLTGSNQTNVKGLIGNVDATVTNSFYDKTVNTGMSDETSYGKSTTELKTLATYTTALADAAWEMGGADGNYATLDFREDRENIWVMAEGTLPVTPTPVTPTPVTPTLTPEKEIEKVITTIVNNQQINVVLPVVTAPVMNFAPPQPIVLNNNLALRLGIPEGASVSLVSAPQSGQESQRVSLNEITSAGVNDTRIALGGGSIIELVNSGVSLPEGVDQEFYVVKNDVTDTSNNKNNKNNKNKGAN